MTGEMSMRWVVAVDLGGEHPEAVLNEAARWVARSGGKLDVVHVEGPRYALDWVGDPAVRQLMQAEAEQLRRTDQARLAEMLTAVPEANRGLARLHEGQPVQALVDLSREYDAMLIATHGRKGLAHFWLGSVAEQVVRSAHCTVVVLRMGAAG